MTGKRWRAGEGRGRRGWVASGLVLAAVLMLLTMRPGPAVADQVDTLVAAAMHSASRSPGSGSS